MEGCSSVAGFRGDDGQGRVHALAPTAAPLHQPDPACTVEQVCMESPLQYEPSRPGAGGLLTRHMCGINHHEARPIVEGEAVSLALGERVGLVRHVDPTRVASGRVRECVDHPEQPVRSRWRQRVADFASRGLHVRLRSSRANRGLTPVRESKEPPERRHLAAPFEIGRERLRSWVCHSDRHDSPAPGPRGGALPVARHSQPRGRGRLPEQTIQ